MYSIPIDDTVLKDAVTEHEDGVRRITLSIAFKHHCKVSNSDINRECKRNVLSKTLKRRDGSEAGCSSAKLPSSICPAAAKPEF